MWLRYALPQGQALHFAFTVPNDSFWPYGRFRWIAAGERSLLE
jgi:hypothetical protein